MPLVHHELCFGCGRTNLFGLLLEAEETAGGRVSARCFIKQDHQGPDRGVAHEGVLSAALSEAMALTGGLDARLESLEVQLLAPAPVGAFVSIEAWRSGSDRTEAEAKVADKVVARGRGDLRRG
jgi:acyl-coenzyme A thioesterase PaaI-like protein